MKNTSSTYKILFTILLVSVTMPNMAKCGNSWKSVDKELDDIDKLDDNTLIKEYNHSRIKELTAPLINL